MYTVFVATRQGIKWQWTALSLLSAILISVLLTQAHASESIESYDLDQAIDIALANNRLRTISQQSLEIAEAQYKQAASTYWPTLTLSMSYTRRDETANYEYPERSFDPMPGFLPPVTIPAQDIDILGRDNRTMGLTMTYPLYTGGKTASIREQAKIGVEIAEQEVIRTQLQVVQDVKRYFYAALYTQHLVELAEDITLSFEVLEDLTKAFYEGGSNSVNKLDLLRVSLTRSAAASTLADLRAKHESALAALSFSMGLDWQQKIRLKDKQYPTQLNTDRLDALIEQAVNFNPQSQQLRLAVSALASKIDEEKSGYFPKVALIGSYDDLKTNLSGGLNTDNNRRSWSIGLGMEMTLFDGGLTKNKVAEARIKHAQMQEQSLLVDDGVASQVKHLFLQLKAAKQQIDITQTSVKTSEEHRQLANRAYNTGAIEASEVIESELYDAMLRANHYRAQYMQAQYLADITYLLGQQL